MALNVRQNSCTNFLIAFAISVKFTFYTSILKTKLATELALQMSTEMRTKKHIEIVSCKI